MAQAACRAMLGVDARYLLKSSDCDQLRRHFRPRKWSMAINPSRLEVSTTDVGLGAKQ
jgi:hypothetical protein